MSESDLQLLKRYANQGVEEAFAEVVRRNLDLVHAAAMRQVRSPEIAEEVTQTVFVELAKQAAKLTPETALAAWLYSVTRRRAIDVVRREAGRRLREQTAQDLHDMNSDGEEWAHVEPLLDDAMDELDEVDRVAVLLRYFQNKSLREVGQAIGITDDAAHKRVSRAVERLRAFFLKRGITIGASGLVVLISKNAALAAPAGLALGITNAAIFAGATSAASGLAASGNFIVMTSLQKAILVVSFAAVVATGLFEAREANIARAETSRLLQIEAAKTQELERQRDEALNRVAALTAEKNSLQEASTELLKLRAEVSRLRNFEREIAGLRANSIAAAPPAQANETELSKASWADVGFSSPQATLRTRGWSVLNTNLERFAESVVITDRARKAFEQTLSRIAQTSQNPTQASNVMRQALENKYAIEEGLLTRLRGENIGGGYTGYRIVSQQNSTPEETILEVETLMSARPPRKEVFTFRRAGEDWKILIDKP